MFNRVKRDRFSSKNLKRVETSLYFFIELCFQIAVHAMYEEN